MLPNVEPSAPAGDMMYTDATKPGASQVPVAQVYVPQTTAGVGVQQVNVATAQQLPSVQAQQQGVPQYTTQVQYPATQVQYRVSQGPMMTTVNGAPSSQSMYRTQLPLILLKSPTHGNCPYCKKEITTRTIKKVGVGNWAFAGAMCLIFPCCFCIPLFMDSFKDTAHFCPECKHPLGVKSAL